MRLILTLVLLALLGGCEREIETSEPGTATASSLDAIAEAYVKIALALRPHDPAYVDAYFGPPEWAAEAEAERRSLAELRAAAALLVTDLHLGGTGEEGMGPMGGMGRLPSPGIGLEKLSSSSLSRVSACVGVSIS